MRPLSINFAWRKERKALVAGVAALTLSLAAAAWVGWLDVAQQRALEGKEDERQTILRSRRQVADNARQAVSQEEKDRQRRELKLAQSVIERLDTPWGVLFSTVESAFDDQVTLLNVEPDPDRREVRLVAEAKNLQAMQAYIRQLRQAPALRDAYLASHQINQQDPLRPVRFVANARWVVPPEPAPQASPENGASEAKAEEAAGDKPASPAGKESP